MRNKLYTLNLSLAMSVSLLMQKDDIAWLWQARFEHLYFRALHNISRKEMARGIPYIEHVEELCDGCALGK